MQRSRITRSKALIAFALATCMTAALAITTNASIVQAAEPTIVPVYRLYNPHSGLHHYTNNKTERNALAQAGWRYENTSFNAVGAGTPVYREYNPHDGNHNWTTNQGEHNHLVQLGWRNEGIAWYAASSGSAVYRLYNPHSGEHVYTIDANEYAKVGAVGWHKEGAAWMSYGTVVQDPYTPPAPPAPKPAPQPAPKPAPAPPAPKPAPQPGVTYKNCTAVWKALGHGLNRGDPGYSPKLDRDGDGKACEKRPQ
ncbi:MAG: excalibur calcium-binding domain-containing protein [Bifidobacterium tibiigranuli]|nr:excalibur calcium-binding domain-containing protein [Bifidobacterium tibiigranuli]